MWAGIAFVLGSPDGAVNSAWKSLFTRMTGSFSIPSPALPPGTLGAGGV